jgi:hypothetical protein
MFLRLRAIYPALGSAPQSTAMQPRNSLLRSDSRPVALSLHRNRNHTGVSVKYARYGLTQKVIKDQHVSVASTAQGSSADSLGHEPPQSSSFTNMFPVWVLMGCLSGLAFPQLYIAWYKPFYVTLMLGVTMLSMGFTLSVEDMTSVLSAPYRVGVGAVLQYTIMPTLGFLLAKLQGLPPPFAAGMILVACCPGGTASNIISYLARADVGLSVMMTTVRCYTHLVLNMSSHDQRNLP